MQTETLLEKIKTLPPEKIIEVENFVELLQSKNKNRVDNGGKPISLRGNWTGAFSDIDLSIDLKEIRSEWLKEWDEKGNFVE